MSDVKSITPNPPADFTPDRQPQVNLTPFRYWCQKVLPLIYDDSLSYYELLCKVIDYLNKTMEDVTNMDTDMTNVYTAYSELQSYVNSYFDSLDVQQEINNKLDDMVKSGELNNIMEPYIVKNTNTWLSSNITSSSENIIDSSLKLENVACNSAVVGYNIEEINNSKLSKLMDKTELMVGENFGHVRATNLIENDSVGLCLKYNVLPGETYYIRGRTYSNIYPLYILGRNETVVSYYPIENDTVYNKYVSVTIPINVYTLYVNGLEEGDSYGGITVLKRTYKNSKDIIMPIIRDGIYNTTKSMQYYTPFKNGFYLASNNQFTDSIHYNTYEINVNYGDNIRFIGRSSGNANIYNVFICLDFDDNILYSVKNTGGDNVDFDITYEIPEIGCKIICTNITAFTKPMILINNKITKYINNKNKTIIWYGTSIPEGKYNRGDKYVSYPDIIGEILGCNVINHSIGGSAVHGYKSLNNITDANPYGFTGGSYSATYKVFSNSLDMQNWLITNYQDLIFTSGTPDVMTDELAETIRNNSYQRILDSYLTTDKFPDLFVFDFGRNDMFYESDWTFDPEEPYSLYQSFESAMNFIIKHILEYRYDAKILIMGHYTNQPRNSSDDVWDFPVKITEGQQNVANYWEIPIFKLWEHTGWSNKTITINGENKSVLAAWLPDKLHPHTDLTGKSINHLAQIIAPYIQNMLYNG